MPLAENDNDFTFSDGTDFDESGFAFQWEDKKPSYDDAGGENKCVYLTSDGELTNVYCNNDGHALCAVGCEDASSESERSRASLPVFALITAGYFFKTFFALVGPSF